MIKVETNEGRVEDEMEGPFINILAETCAMLHGIYDGVPEHLREDFARAIRRNTEPGGVCWMTREQRREQTAKMLRELLARVEGEDEEPEGLGMRFEGEPVKGHPDPVGEPGEPGVPGEPVKADGDCSLEEMTRNAARMAMEKKEAETGESGT